MQKHAVQHARASAHSLRHQFHNAAPDRESSFASGGGIRHCIRKGSQNINICFQIGVLIKIICKCWPHFDIIILRFTPSSRQRFMFFRCVGTSRIISLRSRRWCWESLRSCWRLLFSANWCRWWCWKWLSS